MKLNGAETTITWYSGPWIIGKDDYGCVTMRLRPAHEISEWTVKHWKPRARPEFPDPPFGWRTKP